VIFTGVGIGMLIYIQVSVDVEFNPATTAVSILYTIGNGVLLIPALIIMGNLSEKDVFLLHRLLLSTFIIINMSGDIGFAYHEALTEEEVFSARMDLAYGIFCFLHCVYSWSNLVQ
jgi:hypothetical protein